MAIRAFRERPGPAEASCAGLVPGDDAGAGRRMDTTTAILFVLGLGLLIGGTGTLVAGSAARPG